MSEKPCFKDTLPGKVVYTDQQDKLIKAWKKEKAYPHHGQAFFEWFYTGALILLSGSFLNEINALHFL